MKHALLYTSLICGLTVVGSVSLAQTPDPAIVETSAGPMQISEVASGFEEPWAMAHLPDGRVAVTERDGVLWLIGPDGRTRVDGSPAVYAEGQGGLLDVLIPADFNETREVWLSFAAPVSGGGATAVGKGRLSSDGTKLEGFQTLYAGDGMKGGRHFGSRLVEGPDGAIYLTTGDRGTGPAGLQAQDPSRVEGKVIRLERDGTTDVMRQGWRAGVFSIGHRNIQGAALSLNGQLLVVEHGAQGGDELNLVSGGRNYGWPVISYGVNYGGAKIGEGQAQEGMEQPLHYWDPSIAPSGLVVYSGKLVPEWKGDIFFGSLNSDFLGRLNPDQPVAKGFGEERISSPQTGRVRDVIEAPDGAIWFLSVYDGAIYRLAPAK